MPKKTENNDGEEIRPKIVLDFDVRLFCQNLKATKPPYKCPVDGCGKLYKSFCGIQFHLYNYDHENPDNSVASPAQKGKKKKSRWHHRQDRRSPTPPVFIRSPQRDTLTYAESQRLVEIELDGRIQRLDIHEPIELISQDEIDNHHNTEKEEKTESKTPLKSGKSKTVESKNKVRKETSAPPVKLPEAQFKVLENYVKPNHFKPRPSSYYRYIEKTSDELDEEIEYDMDEEDHSWLELVNETRAKEGSNGVISQEVFETLMDRFEKEAFFQSQSAGKDQNPSIDEDAVCSICQDGECQNSNVILFCDMCNLAVHQECYGVPYIPEGQWLCRRCLQSPSFAVDCTLCPNKGGAFKQTDDSRWAHVVCALWIPEVGFANTVFLEPIDGIERIPPARKKLTCYICKQKSVGACIQCHKTNCYTAFHVTCAQQAGLYMKIEPTREPGPHGTVPGVRKTAYCDVHTPANSDCTSMFDDEDKSMSAKEAKEKSKIKMRKARKILAEKRNAMPVVSIPTIPQSRISKIASKVSLSKKEQFLKRLLSYWTLKRQSRNGVPLLRRLQSNHMARNRDQTKNDQQSSELRDKLKYWQRLRQDLEKARLLVELIRKREKLKREQVRLYQLATDMKLQPFVFLLRQTVEQLIDCDTGNIFTEPVSLEEVPDYLSYIDIPMDFETMVKKVNDHMYKSIDDFEADFNLILCNCMKYNSKDTVFYRAAIKLRDQGGTIMRRARRMADQIGFDMTTGLHVTSPPKRKDKEHIVYEDFDTFMMKVREGTPLEEQLNILLDKMDETQAARSGKKSKFMKRIRREIVSIRRKMAIKKGQTDTDDGFSADTASTTEAVSTDSETPPPSPIHSPNKLTTSPTRNSSNRSPEKFTPVSKSTPGSRGRGRGRGRWRGRGRGGSRPRISSNKSESENDHSTSKQKAEDTDQNSDGDDLQSSTAPTPSPASGVNRRTAVLFNSKKPRGGSVPKSPTGPPTVRKGPGRPPKPRPMDVDLPPPVLEPMVNHIPTSPSGRKRSMSTGGSRESGGRPSPPKRAMSLNDTMPSLQDQSDMNRESFKVYRRAPAGIRSSSESESTSGMSSGDEMFSESSSETSSNNSRSGRRRSPSFDSDDVIPLEPLDLVWAKCRGYPWYPALIINPKMPKTGYFHNGVPIPVPPEDVLLLKYRYDEQVYLVLFFDTKRTWQWLPRSKLEPLGVDSELDKHKLLENKKPNVRKAVQKAYEKAIVHRCNVNGEPNPLLAESSSED